jgi:hypothetical protein
MSRVRHSLQAMNPTQHFFGQIIITAIPVMAG